MTFAKAAMDVGLMTHQKLPQLAFWQEQIGLELQEMLPVGGGVQQHRHGIGDTVFKLNHHRDPIEAGAPSGIRQLTIAREGVDAPHHLTDPDGNPVSLVPPGHEGVQQIQVEVEASDVERSHRFYTEALGFEPLADDVVACGVSQIRLVPGRRSQDPDQRGIGYRYLTVQIFDVLKAHAFALANGGREGRAPIRLGDVAHFSFVLDPDGTWIELSQRKSIVGTLD